MNNLFDKPLNQLTDEEKSQLTDKQKKAFKALIGSAKPSVPFSSVTLNDCVRPDGLALDLRFIEPIAVPAPTLHIPQEIIIPVPSDFLCEHLLTVQKFYVLNNEKACRMLIDAILLEVLKSEFNDSLSGFCEVKNDWEGTGFGYTGDVDYMFGSSKTKSVDTMDSFLLVVVAKKEWPDSAIPQVLAEAGCLLKKRLAAGKNTPVFAVLTNGLLFRFFAIDTDGVVYASKTHSSLSEILRWFTWFMTAIMTEKAIGDSLTQLRNCFGPKNPIFSKKIRIQK
ncbi:hypothetical protein BDR26DRAFT_886797 [Obelidium mucronatum]|nr:hypothetical protein BDR26DRAFT_886797 [Obelidium mucronatum]